MAAPDKIFMPNELLSEDWTRHIEGQDTAYVRVDFVWGRISELMQNSKDCFDAVFKIGCFMDELKEL